MQLGVVRSAPRNDLYRKSARNERYDFSDDRRGCGGMTVSAMQWGARFPAIGWNERGAVLPTTARCERQKAQEASAEEREVKISLTQSHVSVNRMAFACILWKAKK